MQKPTSCDEVVKVYGIAKDGGTVCKKPCWNVRIDGEVHQMWFGTKRAAKAYLKKRQGKTLVEILQNTGDSGK